MRFRVSKATAIAAGSLWLWSLALVLASACTGEATQVTPLDDESLGRSQHAVIECNGDTIGQVCDSDDDPCTQEVCVAVGQNVLCSLEQFAPDGTACQSDGLPCTSDTCQAGTCSHTPLPAGTLCDDGLFCTTGDSCGGDGTCGGGTPHCADGNPCTDDVCDEDARSCSNPPLDGDSCDDGNACTEDSTCSAGSCGGGSPVLCEDNSGCTIDSCDAVTGCVFTPDEDAPCSDDFFCTTAEVCSMSGVCEGEFACDDNDPCTADACDDLDDLCNNTIIPGGNCNDSNPCTNNDLCDVEGACAGSNLPNGTPCSNDGGCTSGGVCTNGSCNAGTAEPDNTPCDDEDACTLTDACLGGSCVGYPRNCSDGDPCTADGCDPVSGCFHEPIDGCEPPSDAGVPDAGVEPGEDAGANSPDAGLVDAGRAARLGGGGCSSTQGRGTSLIWALLLAALLWTHRRTARGIRIFVMLVGLGTGVLLPGAAHAQEGFDSEIFKAGASDTSYLSQSSADVLPAWSYQASFALNVASNPLVLRDPMTGDEVPGGSVVSRRDGAYLAAALGLYNLLEVGLVVPLVLNQNGDGSMVGGRDLEGAQLGDPRLDIKGRLLRRGPFQLAAALSTTLPFGDAEGLYGEENVSISPRFIAGLRLGRVSLAANWGMRIRPETQIGELSVSDEFLVGLGCSYEFLSDRLWLVAEAYASRAVKDNVAENRPAELLAGARYQVVGPWQLYAAAGVGIGSGYGTPALRGLLGLAYAPRAVTKPAPPLSDPEPVVVEPTEPLPPVDSDEDGIIDPDDACPKEAEDKDGFEDDNGCPDPDNDNDQIADADDQCPLEAEVVNGIKDEDGCPDEGIIIMVEDRVVLDETVLFDMNRARVKRAGRKALKAIVDLYKQHPEWDVMRVEGHADSRGPEDYNQRLSKRRADRVVNEMIDLGMDPDRISSVGFGSSKPMVQGTSDEDLHKNRRVEFVILNFRKELREKAGPAPSSSEEPSTEGAQKKLPKQKPEPAHAPPTLIVPSR